MPPGPWSRGGEAPLFLADGPEAKVPLSLSLPSRPPDSLSLLSGQVHTHRAPSSPQSLPSAPREMPGLLRLTVQASPRLPPFAALGPDLPSACHFVDTTVKFWGWWMG